VINERNISQVFGKKRKSQLKKKVIREEKKGKKKKGLGYLERRTSKRVAII